MPEKHVLKKEQLAHFIFHSLSPLKFASFISSPSKIHAISASVFIFENFFSSQFPVLFRHFLYLELFTGLDAQPPAGAQLLRLAFLVSTPRAAASFFLASYLFLSALSFQRALFHHEEVR